MEPDTPMSYGPNTKKGKKSAARYAIYAPATTVGQYHALCIGAGIKHALALADLRFDLLRGHARVFPAIVAVASVRYVAAAHGDVVDRRLGDAWTHVVECARLEGLED